MSVTKTFPAPVRGWVENENLAANAGLGASVLENFFPLQATVRVRGGALRFATIGPTNPVRSLIPYAGASRKLFAAGDSAVYDITISGASEPAAAISSLTSGYWSAVQLTPGSGTQHLIMVNGSDTGRHYDGSSWAAYGSGLSISGVDTADLGHVWVHQNRVWFAENGTLKAWYLDVDSVAGTATAFAMGAVFQKGGTLYLGASWSASVGDGLSENNVFVSSEGEVLVYAGTDPSDPAEWGLIGRYEIGRPVSKQVMRAGADLLIATTDGIVPMSQIVTKDPAALALAAISYPIEPAWRRAIAANTTGASLQMLKWQREGMGIVGYPHRNETHVVNLTTGAWSKWTGLDVQCMALHNDIAYFGTASGAVLQFEGAGSDDGAIYVSRYSGLPDHLGVPGAYKQVLQARATFRSLAPFAAKLSAATDFRREFPTPPNAETDVGSPSLWDVGTWDVSKWDDGPNSEERVTATTLWKSIGRSGYSVSPQVQISNGSSRRPDAELAQFDLLYEPGGVVV